MAQPDLSRTDLRLHPRVRLRAPFTCSFSRRGLKWWLAKQEAGLGVVFNVSMTGVKILGEAELRPGDRVSMSLRLPKQTSPMNVEEGTVRWVREQMVGVEFTRLSPAEEWRLWKFMELFSNKPR